MTEAPWPGDRAAAEEDEGEDEADAAEAEDTGDDELPRLRAAGEHAEGELDIPDDVNVLEGSPVGGRRGVGIVVARVNGEITTRLLDEALDELERAGVARAAITVMPVPGAFELPLAAMALAKTRRYACIVALGCIIRGETPHF